MGIVFACEFCQMDRAPWLWFWPRFLLIIPVQLVPAYFPLWK